MSTLYFNQEGKALYFASVDDIDYSGDLISKIIPDKFVDINSLYLDKTTDTVTAKKTMNLVVSTNRIDNIPIGSEVSSKYFDWTTINTGYLELSVSYNETVSVYFKSIEYFDTIVEVPCEA